MTRPFTGREPKARSTQPCKHQQNCIACSRNDACNEAEKRRLIRKNCQLAKQVIFG